MALLRNKRFIVFIMLVFLVFLYHEKLSFANIQNVGNTLIAHAEDKWNSIRGIELSGIEGESFLIMNQQTGTVLYSDHGKDKMYPASTTKILTALLLLEKCDPNELVTVGDEVLQRAADESSAGLVPGEQLTVRDLAAAMMLPSGNDAARTAAVYTARSVTGESLNNEQAIAYFIDLMNERAKALGANESHFTNPHGLHDPDHYSTAYDLALITREAMNHTEFREIVGEPVYAPGNEDADTGQHVYQNRNKLLDSNGEWFVQGVNGVKTGYTEKAGYCLVSSAVRDGQEIIVVVLNSSEQGVWSDSVKLLEYGLDKLD